MFDARGRALPFNEIRGAFSLFSWSLAVLVKPVAERVIHLVVLYPSITPNLVTAIGLTLRLTVALLFFVGNKHTLFSGALVYYCVAVLDAVDGPLARLTGCTSEFGRYFDHISDLVGDFLILSALAVGLGLVFEPVVIGMLFMHIAESYISYVTNIALNVRSADEIRFLDGKGGLVEVFIRYRQYFFQKNLKSFISFPDYALLTFMFFPMAGNAAMGLYVGFGILLLSTLYTILSTFAALHSSATKFP